MVTPSLCPRLTSGAFFIVRVHRLTKVILNFYKILWGVAKFHVEHVPERVGFGVCVIKYYKSMENGWGIVFIELRSGLLL